MSITSSQLESFAQDGYLIVKGGLNLEEQTALIQWAEEVKNWPNETGKWMPYLEIDSLQRTVVSRVENYADYHDGFNKLLRGDKILSILSQLSDNETMHLFKEKINYKLAHAGGFGAHTDAPAYKAGDSLSHLTILLAVEPNHLGNGCLEVVAGSHKDSIPMDAEQVLEKDWCDANEWIPVELATGDMLIFGSHLAHRSGPNESEFGRAAVYATYNRGEDQHDIYYKSRRSLWPPTFERVKGEKYEEGRLMYGYASPMLTIV